MITNGDGLPDDDGYLFNPDHLYDHDETLRRFAVISVSKRGLTEYEPVLLRMLSSDPSEDMRRHVVRALGNIRSHASILPILHILSTEKGLIAGDAAEALGKLKAEEARDELIRQSTSEVQWVAQKCRWALKQLSTGM
jgi:HEAT repeat protein